MAVELTDEEIKHLCKSVTPEQRRFCAAHMNHCEWPENFVLGASKEPGQDVTQTPPFTEQQWWEIINERVVNTGHASSDESQ